MALNDLNQRFPICDPKTGLPTDYFMRILNGNAADTLDAETADAWEVQAGNGLTGGGPVPSGVTLNVGAGTGIQVNADDVALAPLSPDPSGSFTNSNITVDAFGRVTAAANGSGGGGTSEGTSFPGSPSTGDRYYRTDRNIGYFYDGTRWLSEALSVAVSGLPGATTATANIIFPNPCWGLYDIYIEKFFVTYNANNSTASNYFVTQLQTADGASVTGLGSGLSGKDDTISTWVSHSETLNTVVASTIDALIGRATETGTASTQIGASFTFRMIG